MAVEQSLTYEAVCDFAVRWVDRWNAHDVEGILSMVSDDVVWEDPAFDGLASGREASWKYIEPLFRAFPDIRWDMPNGLYISPTRDDRALKIAQPWCCRATVTGPIDPPGFAPTGKAFELEGVDLWELCLEHGLLKRVTSHYDALEFARRVGLMPGRWTRAERMLVRSQRLREWVRR